MEKIIDTARKLVAVESTSIQAAQIDYIKQKRSLK